MATEDEESAYCPKPPSPPNRNQKRRATSGNLTPLTPETERIRKGPKREGARRMAQNQEAQKRYRDKKRLTQEAVSHLPSMY
jgi:hypothetical protein